MEAGGGDVDDQLAFGRLWISKCGVARRSREGRDDGGVHWQSLLCKIAVEGSGSCERLKNQEAGNDGLEQKEDRVELMIALVTRDCSSDQTREIKEVTDKIYRP